ncbi:MAG TPA: hypothetical protein VGR22_11265 [Thermomicrobiales bacterium]|nr:hypothetical protein [Thermomicrobiales bacterium]
MRRVLCAFLMLAVLIGMSGAAVAAQDGTPAVTDPNLLADLGYPELRVTTDGTTNDFPTEVEAGRYHVVLDNQSDQMEIDLEFWQLPEGVTVDDVMAFFEEAQETGDFGVPDFFFDMTFNGGPTTSPGQSDSVVLDLTPGEWYVNVYSYNPETDESTDTVATVTVTGEMPELPAPEADVTVELVDFDFAVSGSVSSGPQIWEVTGAGSQPHHLVLSRVPEGTTEEDVIELAGTFFVPPPDPSATPAATPVIQPALAFEDVEEVFYTLIFTQGQYNLYDLTLEPGTYAMICFLPAPDGTPHVLMGMVEIITVE